MDFEFKPPYQADGSCSFARSEFFNREGIYLIRQRDEVVYVGRGACVYRTAYRHFAKWCNGKPGEKWYDRADPTLEMALIKGDGKMEEMLVKALRPRDNVHYKDEETEWERSRREAVERERLEKAAWRKECEDAWNAYVRKHGHEPF
jgi:hypothetical protein